jgi:ABC-type antimicrobial peptide transport system permease subunit
MLFSLTPILQASRVQISDAIFATSFVLAAGGIGLGLAGTAALTDVMQKLLFGVSANDALTLILVAVVMFTITLSASLIPARRAMSVDPVVALRQE